MIIIKTKVYIAKFYFIDKLSGLMLQAHPGITLSKLRVILIDQLE
jgi:hypothetical protein